MPIFLGAAIGGFLGFLLRPSVPLIGQLPFDTVITRGASLTGLDVLLRGAAEASFNYMVVGVVVGALVGLAIKQRSNKTKAN